jgi:hypothetical protein
MIRFYMRLILLPSMIFMAVVLLIRAQPNDDHVFRQALMPGGCLAPCFMGIRPGVTTSKDALTLLKTHSWIAAVNTIDSEKPDQIWWTWNQNAPDILKSAPISPTFPINGEVHSNSELVSSIRFRPNLTLGDIVLAMGLPPASQFVFGGIILIPNRSVPAIITLEYEKDGFWATGTAKCPYTANLWDIPAQLTITNDFNGMSLGTVRPIDRATFLDSIRRTSNLMCRL